MQVDFDHAIGDRLLIKEIGRIGHVEVLSFDNLGKQYRVIYWDGGERKAVWMYAREIDKTENAK